MGVQNATRKCVNTANELVHLIRLAAERRDSRCTQSNDGSSRTHMVIDIHVVTERRTASEQPLVTAGKVSVVSSLLAAFLLLSPRLP